MKLGTIKTLDPTTLGIHEEHQFTPWLLDNLDQLGEVLGIDIAVEEREREVYVGRYIVDIVAREAGSNRKIIIENQLRPSDHSHLGQLLTYAGGTDSEIIVWVCHELREEHRRALDWLNAKVDGVGFFGVEFEVIKIDDSRPTFRFVNVVRPSEWSEVEPNDSSNTINRYRPFFQQLIDELREKHRFTNVRKAQERNWCNFSTGHAGLHYSTAFIKDNELRVGLYIQTKNAALNTAIFDALEDQQETITKDVGAELLWDRADDRQYCRISISCTGSIDDQDSWTELQDWSVGQLLRLRETFSERLPAAISEAKSLQI